MARILIIEDEDSIQELYSDLFIEHGHEVYTLDSGFGWEQYVSKYNIDLVTLDVMMPGKNGIQILGEIRSQYSYLPIILLTAFGEFRQVFNQWTSDAYIVKSVDTGELINTISRLCKLTFISNKLEPTLDEKLSYIISFSINRFTRDCIRVTKNIEIPSSAEVLNEIIQLFSNYGYDKNANILSMKDINKEILEKCKLYKEDIEVATLYIDSNRISIDMDYIAKIYVELNFKILQYKTFSNIVWFKKNINIEKQ